MRRALAGATLTVRRAAGTGTVYQKTYRLGGKLLKVRTYTLAYRVDGRTVRETTKATSRQAAETILRTRLSALDRGELPTSPGATSWEDLAEMIRGDYLANARRSASRLEVSLAHLAQAFDGQRAASITTERLVNYAKRRLEEGAARATVNRELAALRRAFRLARAQGKVLIVPDVPMLKESNARQGFFERRDFGRLVRALPRDLRPCAITTYVTGWRMTSEILTRQWRHVDLRAGWLRLEPNETKSGEGRMFPLIPELRAALRWQRKATSTVERQLGRIVPWVYHHQGEPLFYQAKKGGLLPSKYLREAWLAACAAAGIDGRLRHDFRRTAARDLLRSGVPGPAVMKAVGWSSEAMMRRYAIVDEGMLREAGEKRARLR